MRVQPGIKHLFDLGLALKPLGEFPGRGAVRAHTQGQSLQPLEKHPGVERAHARPSAAQEGEHLVHKRSTPQYGAADTAPLAVEKLGRRVNDHIGAEGERPLQRRRAEAVVHHQQRPGAARDAGHRGQIGHLAQGVRRRLQVQQAGVLAQRVAPAPRRQQRHEADLDAEFGQIARKQRVRGAEHIARAQHVVTRFEQRHGGAEDSGHPRGRRHAGLGAFEKRQALFEAAHRGVGIARINVAGHVSGKARGGLGGAVEDIA